MRVSVETHPCSRALCIYNKTAAPLPAAPRVLLRRRALPAGGTRPQAWRLRAAQLSRGGAYGQCAMMLLFPGYLISPAPNGGPANAGNAPIDCEALSRLGDSLIRPPGSPNRCSGASCGTYWKELPGLSSTGPTPSPHRSDRHWSEPRRADPSGRTEAGLRSAGQSPWAESRRTGLDITNRPGRKHRTYPHRTDHHRNDPQRTDPSRTGPKKD